VKKKMEAIDGQMAEINLKTLFVTCKSQWNGDLSKLKEVGNHWTPSNVFWYVKLISLQAETTLKATQNALQALLQQVSIRYKENDKQMKKLQTQLSVRSHLKCRKKNILNIFKILPTGCCRSFEQIIR
jgi:hypothetical protein